MPTSWSIEAAHSSSRSPSAGVNSPAVTSESNIWSESLATCSTCVMSDSYWTARLRTAASRTLSNSGGSPSSSVRARNTPSRRPASVASIPSKPPSETTVSSTTAEARMMSPRPGLIPGTRPRSSTDIEASSVARSDSTLAVMTNPWTPRSSAPWAAWAAAARLRTAPPMPTIRGPDEPSQSSPDTVSCDVVAQLGEVLLLDRAVAGEELLGDADGAEREGDRLVPAAVGDVGELHAAAADVEHHAVGQRGGVDGGDVAVVRLLLRRQRLDRQAGGGLGVGEELLAVGGVADRAGGDDVDVLGAEVVGAAEAGKHPEGLQAAPDRLVAELARGGEAGADADRLIQLVGELPPRGGRARR